MNREKIAVSPEMTSTAILAAAFCLFTSGLLYLLLNLPGVPSNVQELFRSGGNFLDLLTFSLAILWIGFGAAWAGWRSARSMYPGIVFPVLACACSIVLFTLLSFSVTEESMKDITGTQIWAENIAAAGGLGKSGEDNLKLILNPIESMIRVGSLIAPLLLLISVGSAANYRRFQSPRPLIKYETHSFSYWVGRYCLYALPWIILSHILTYHWASTDNISGLIDDESLGGMGGILSLYLLITLLACMVFGVAYICAGMDSGGLGAKNRLHRAGYSALILVGGVPFTWWLLNAAMADVIYKEGYQFSGVDFLLGPDRSELVSVPELALRWSLLQFAGVLLLAFGVYLFLRQVKAPVKKAAPQSDDQDRGDMAYVRANLSVEQVSFLDEVAQEMETDQSGVLARILDQLEDITAQLDNQQLRAILRAQEGKQISELSMSSKLYLSPHHMSLIHRLGRQSRMTDSRVVRRSITWFMHGLAATEQTSA
ncbi:hypothetical protein HBA55_26115 [Pseudomaricurvus alkylphenolicus]|uniref:hypothetical protein n=1 Tax=Pseudomaricurvus alkylphenolicus TaxID=1306991 RepID=UPI00142473B9|nr:hypothetical protein [Pseudomaricurvus alkylphenolicus]NIB43110.1 hypothetical protein [Pseudomaricurvus alkylphenolicus]